MASKVKDKDRQSNKDKEDALAALEMAQQAHDRFNSPEHRQKWLDTHDTNKSGCLTRALGIEPIPPRPHPHSFHRSSSLSLVRASLSSLTTNHCVSDLMQRLRARRI